jgi:uncharacterized protein
MATLSDRSATLCEYGSDDWDPKKNRENQTKHGVSFEQAQYAFADPQRVIAEDFSHSTKEKRYYCSGMTGGGVLTVRFSYREGMIRIFGAGYWRKGKRIYEPTNPIHRRAPGAT